jgi:hypothetical protein
MMRVDKVIDFVSILSNQRRRTTGISTKMMVQRSESCSFLRFSERSRRVCRSNTGEGVIWPPFGQKVVFVSVLLEFSGR